MDWWLRQSRISGSAAHSLNLARRLLARCSILRTSRLLDRTRPFHRTLPRDGHQRSANTENGRLPPVALRSRRNDHLPGPRADALCP